jgi:DNA-binding beta-propeller fold protein YncE
MVSSGRSVAASDSDTLFVARPAGVIEAYDFATLAKTGTTNTACNFGTTSRIASFNDDASFLQLQGEVLCLYGRRATAVPPDQYAEFRFLDLGLEECVIAAATANGLTAPAQIVQLDCSDAARTILSLEGIERLTNLELLDLSGHDITDLAPAAGLDELRTFVAINAGLTGVQPLLALDLLTSADLRGNPAIRCNELDQLAQGGVAVAADICTETATVELGGIGAELVVDAPGNRAFVSVPSLRQIVEVSLGSAGVSRRLSLAQPPRGIDLSQDRQTIYAALNGAGDIAYVNVATGAAEVIDISALLGDDRTWDIAEVSANRIVASSNPGSNGLAWIVEVRRDQANAAQRVAGQQIIRAAPIFAVSADGTAVYVGESTFSPESLYKLDATQADLPLVLEDDHGEVGGADGLALSPDGAIIYLRNGQALDTATFVQIASFGPGPSAVTNDGQLLLVANATTDSATEYDLQSTAPTGQRHFGCNLGTVAAIEELGAGGIIVLGNDLLCFTQTVSYP